MDRLAVLDARRLSDGTLVAVNDVVTVEISGVEHGQYERLGNVRKFKARIVGFDSDGITFDLSQQFYSIVEKLYYGSITSVTHL